MTAKRRGKKSQVKKTVAVVKQSAPVGRPTAYRPEYAEQTRKLCLLGATVADLAVFFDVRESTIYEWIKAHPEFSESIKSGRDIADAEVASRLYERAIGCSHAYTDVKVIGDEVVLTELVKHYPPDTAAAFIWLKNRQPARWRDKVEVEQKTEITMAKREDLDKIYAKHMAEMEQTKAVEGRGRRMVEQGLIG